MHLKGSVHLAPPGGWPICDPEFTGPFTGYDPDVSVWRGDFITKDGYPAEDWCPQCRRWYFEEVIELKEPGTRPHCQTREADYHDIGLLPLCQDLWMQANGSSDPAPDEIVERDTTYLTMRLAEWRKRDCGEEQNAIDEAVRVIVFNTIKIVNQEQDRKRERESKL